MFMCIHTHTHTRHVEQSVLHQAADVVGSLDHRRLLGLYKIFFHLFCVCARINHPFITPARSYYPHYCNTIARL